MYLLLLLLSNFSLFFSVFSMICFSVSHFDIFTFVFCEIPWASGMYGLMYSRKHGTCLAIIFWIFLTTLFFSFHSSIHIICMLEYLKVFYISLQVCSFFFRLFSLFFTLKNLYWCITMIFVFPVLTNCRAPLLDISTSSFQFGSFFTIFFFLNILHLMRYWYHNRLYFGVGADLFFFFLDKVSQCILGWPGTC
jgi:hypothetical protein